MLRLNWSGVQLVVLSVSWKLWAEKDPKDVKAIDEIRQGKSNQHKASWFEVSQNSGQAKVSFERCEQQNEEIVQEGTEKR